VRLALALFVVVPAASLSGCLGPSAENGTLAPADLPLVDRLAPVLFGGYLHEYFDIPVDGPQGRISIHLDLWRPDPATFVGDDASLAEAPAPVVVDMGPYFGSIKRGEDRRTSHYVHKWMFEHMIPRGYAFAAVENAGSAGSTGCWDFMGPNEVAGAAAAVDWLGSQPWSNGKVGMIGKSYDGMTQIMAASRNPQHLATIVPVAPLTHAYAGVYMNGVPYLGFWGGALAAYTVLTGIADIPTHTPERVPNAVARAPHMAQCTPENVVGGLGNLGDYNEYYQKRDFRESAKTLSIPVFFMQGFLDANVRPDNAFPYVNDLPGPKMVWLGQWRHDYANATWAGREDMYLALHRWFDRWLLGIDNGIENELGIVVQDSQGNWRREETWPPADAQPLLFRLAEGRLVADPAAQGTFSRFVDDGNPEWHLGRARPVQAPLPNYVVYYGEPLTHAAHVAGPAVLEIHVKSNGPRGQIVALLLDCPATGSHECDLVAYGAMNLLHRNGLARGEPLTPGEAVRAVFELQPRDYVFAAGRVPALVLAGTDGRFFMPEPTRNVLTIFEDDERPSSLQLPLVARGPETVLFTACGVYQKSLPCYDPERKDAYHATKA